MTAQWIWLAAAAIFTLVHLFVRFRPLLSIVGALLGGSLAALFGSPWWLQILVFLVSLVVLECIFRRLFRLFRREKDDPRILAIVGGKGKIQDVLDAKKDILLMHNEGGDWVVLPEQPGQARLGDRVEVVGVRGKKAVVRRIAP
jgi:membrane protein implicated in regulation of membrane protease activity